MNNSSLQQRKDKAISQGQGTLSRVYIDRAKNSEVWDIEGKRYIDLGSGIAVVNTGHQHPAVLAAVKAQLQHFEHTCLTVTPYVSAIELAEKLNAAVPGHTAKKTALVTTGAEAVENAVKIARAYTGRPGAIAFHGAFHGRTNLTLGLTGKVKPYKSHFGPFPGEIFHVPYPNAYHGVSVEESLRALQMLFEATIEPSRVAAIIIEPVQGEGGFYIAPVEFLRALRALCDQHKIVLICDEVQSGFARSGKLFAIEYADIEPDLITLAKGMAAGFPLAAVVGKAHIMDAPVPGGLGGTYSGSPISCAAALAVFDVIEREDLCQRALTIGEKMTARLKLMQANYPSQIGDIRMLGAMVAFEMVQAGCAATPDAALTDAIVKQGAINGLIILPCGIRGNTIRLLPPLTISDALLDESMDLLETTLGQLIAA